MTVERWHNTPLTKPSQPLFFKKNILAVLPRSWQGCGAGWRNGHLAWLISKSSGFKFRACYQKKIERPARHGVYLFRMNNSIDTEKLAGKIYEAITNNPFRSPNRRIIKETLDKHLLPPAPSEFPDPPEGCRWHNPDNLTPEQVGITEGWRLALESEIATDSLFENCIAWFGGTWNDRHEWAGNDQRVTYRTKNPLPVKPDPYAELKAAYAAGKAIQYHVGGSEWVRVIDPSWIEPIERYRIKPETKRAPLGPEDVVVGSLVRRSDWPANCEDMIISKTDYDVCFGVLGDPIGRWSYAELMEFQIKRPGEDWQPAYKEIEAS